MLIIVFFLKSQTRLYFKIVVVYLFLAFLQNQVLYRLICRKNIIIKYLCIKIIRNMQCSNCNFLHNHNIIVYVNLDQTLMLINHSLIYEYLNFKLLLNFGIFFINEL